LHIQLEKRKADLEFESAKRRIMEENQVLRKLLRRIGITDAEVETYLSDSNHAATPAPLGMK
jgi:predicted solute-binding protein